VGQLAQEGRLGEGVWGSHKKRRFHGIIPGCTPVGIVRKTHPFSVGHKPNHSKFHSNTLYSLRLNRLQDLDWMDSRTPFQPLQFCDFHP